MRLASESCDSRCAGMSDRRFGRALPPDGLAVAGLSGRRLLLFQRPRMGGRGRRRRRAPRRCTAGSRRCSPTAPASAMPCCSRTPIAPRTRATIARWPRSPSSPRRSRPRANGIWRRRRRAAPSSTRRSAAWPCAALDRLAMLSCRRASPIRSRSASAAAGHGMPLDAGARRLPAGARRQLGLGRRAPDSARPDRRPARARRAGAGDRGHRAARARRRARRYRQRALPRRHRQRCGTRRSTRGCSGAA